MQVIVDAGRWMHTGDLATMDTEGYVNIVGRLKDVITMRGRSYYPEDLELAAQECHEGLLRGCGAAFAIDNDGSQTVILVQEVSRKFRVANTQPIAEAIREAILRKFDLHIDEVVFMQEGSLPRTSTGQFQRDECWRLFLNGALNRIAAIASVEALAAPRNLSV